MKKVNHKPPTAENRSSRDKVLHAASPLLAIAGLILLGFYAAGRKTPETGSGREKHEFAPQPASRMAIAQITPVLTGRRLDVSGRLKTIDLPGPGSRAPYVLTLEEDGAELEIVFWSDVFEQMNQSLPVPGKQICVQGRIGLYKGRLQLKVRNAEDFFEENGRLFPGKRRR